MLTTFQASFQKLVVFCEKEQFKGYDPYDGLNSRLFKSIPVVKNNRLARIAWIQFFKRSPLNLRKIVGIQKEYNAKALGLFLSGYCHLYKSNPSDAYLQKIKFFAEKIHEQISPGYSGACWGYNFDWEARAFFQPKNMPTVVASSFIANGLLDAFEITGEQQLLTTARSTCDFILKDLNRTYDNEGNYAFSYSPADKSVVFNASLLGAKLLVRTYSFTKEEELLNESRKAVVFCCNYQQPNGAWSYGTLPFHQWIDNFHTGYNLECIADYVRFSGEHQYSVYVEKGFDYYIKNFFTPEGIPKYYNNSVYPVDIHTPSQLVITLYKLDKFEEHKELMDKVLNWTIVHMQSEKGYFYYQVNKYFTSRIPYMRWSQAWMFYAYSVYFSKIN
jgi:rhamnogalacturonyl hydrolase YesR